MTLLDDGANNKKLPRNEKKKSLKTDNAKASNKFKTLLLTSSAPAYCLRYEHAQVVRRLSEREKKTFINGLICVTLVVEIVQFRIKNYRWIIININDTFRQG